MVFGTRYIVSFGKYWKWPMLVICSPSSWSPVYSGAISPFIDWQGQRLGRVGGGWDRKSISCTSPVKRQTNSKAACNQMKTLTSTSEKSIFNLERSFATMPFCLRKEKSIFIITYFFFLINGMINIKQMTLYKLTKVIWCNHIYSPFQVSILQARCKSITTHLFRSWIIQVWKEKKSAISRWSAYSTHRCLLRTWSFKN